MHRLQSNSNGGTVFSLNVHQIATKEVPVHTTQIQSLALATGEPKQLWTFQYQAATTQTQGTKQSITSHKSQSEETGQLLRSTSPTRRLPHATQTTNTRSDGTFA